MVETLLDRRADGDAAEAEAEARLSASTSRVAKRWNMRPPRDVISRS